MNIKLSLLITLAALGGNMNAETIRERLIREKEVTEVRAREELAKQMGTGFLHSITLLGNKNMPQQVEETFNKIELNKIYPLMTRIKLLHDMSDCINAQYSWKPEKEAADVCFDKLTYWVDLGSYSKSQAELKIAQQELKKIGQKDLRRSWFWWVQ